MESDTYFFQPAGWNTSIVGFKLTLSRYSSKYIFLYYLPTGRKDYVKYLTNLRPEVAIEMEYKNSKLNTFCMKN